MSLPLSRFVPKGLYEVKGEVLIERQIRQLREAGIKEIIVVVGYLKEQFQYLKEKYNVLIIENEDYYRYNNISSIYAARDYLKTAISAVQIIILISMFLKNMFMILTIHVNIPMIMRKNIVLQKQKELYNRNS